MPRGLDTYVGRKVTRTEVDSDGNWFVELEGEVRVINTDPNNALTDLPGGGKDFVFTTVIIEETQTQMVLNDSQSNEWRVLFNPMQYQIYDAEAGGGAWAPQVEAEPLAVPPDPSAERVADGPEQQAQAEVAEEDTKKSKKSSKSKKSDRKND